MGYYPCLPHQTLLASIIRPSGGRETEPKPIPWIEPGNGAQERLDRHDSQVSRLTNFSGKKTTQRVILAGRLLNQGPVPSLPADPGSSA